LPEENYHRDLGCLREAADRRAQSDPAQAESLVQKDFSG
jgi:hypothetical protein